MTHSPPKKAEKANTRDEFGDKTRDTLAKRVGYHCSFPNCTTETSGPHKEPDKAVNSGFAAHICAAAEGGPRYDKNQTPEQRSSAENGIWLCGKHATIIDKDEIEYTVEKLHEWKRLAEEAQRERQIHGSTNHTEPPYNTFNLPSQNPHFTGRENILQAISRHFKDGQATALTQTLTGLGGIGKSQIAVEYAY